MMVKKSKVNKLVIFPNNFSHRNQFLNQLNSNNYYNNNNNEFMNRARIVHNKIKRKRPVSCKKASISQGKSLNFIHKYYDENFILEEDDEEEIINRDNLNTEGKRFHKSTKKDYNYYSGNEENNVKKDKININIINMKINNEENKEKEYKIELKKGNNKDINNQKKNEIDINNTFDIKIYIQNEEIINNNFLSKNDLNNNENNEILNKNNIKNKKHLSIKNNRNTIENEENINNNTTIIKDLSDKKFINNYDKNIKVLKIINNENENNAKVLDMNNIKN